MHRAVWNGAWVGAMALFLWGAAVHAEAPAPAAHAGGDTLTVYDFEAGLQDWAIPDWAKEKDEDVGRVVSTSQEVASHGKGSMQVLADFPGGTWTGAYVEVAMYVTDWSQFSSVSADVYLPANAPSGLQGRFILTTGENWTWTEMNRAIKLEPGKWTMITANLKPGSLDWKFFPTDAFRKDIRKLGFRVESDKKPVYSGPIYVDNIRLNP